MAETKPAVGTMDNDKVLAAVSALPLVGLIVYLAMKDASPFVKNYARQGSLLFLASIAGFVLSFVPFVGWILSCVVSLAMLVGVIMLIVNALQEVKDYRLPLVADLAEQVFK